MRHITLSLLAGAVLSLIAAAPATAAPGDLGADTAGEACRLAGTHLFVVKQNRFNRPIQKLREAVQEGRFGKIVLATVRVRWRRDQSYYDKDEIGRAHV